MRHVNRFAILFTLLPTLAFGQGISPAPSSGGGGSGTVTNVSVSTANGVSGSVANPTTTPAITLTLSAITPTTVNGNTITSGTGTLTLGSATLDAANIPLLNASTNAFTGTLLSISGGATLPTPTATSVLQIARGTTAGASIEIDSFNANGFVVQRRAQTSSTSPGAITNGLQLGSNLFQGWNATSYVTGASVRANSTTTTWDGTHNGASLTFQTTADASATATDQLRIQGSGGLSVGNANVATDPGAGGILATTVTIGAGSAITSSGAGGALGTNAFTSTAYLPLTGGILSGNLTISGAGFITSGSLSAAAWTTNGVRTQMAAASYTDTSSSGTVANAYTDLFGAGTILASSVTTYTSYYGAFFKAPVASTNVTMTNKSALGADTVSIGGAAQSTFALAVTGTASISGALTASSLNGNTFTTGTYTLTGQAGKTLTFNGSITLTGTDAQTYTFPTTTATIARTDAAQTFTGSNTFTNSTNFGGNISLTAAGGVIQLRTNATLLTSPVNAQLQHGAADAAGPVAQTISFQSVVAGNANTAAPATTTIQGPLSNGSGVGGDIAITTTQSVAASGTQNTALTAILIKGGTQNVRLPQITADTALTDTTVCQDTTNHALFSGTGTAGICLGNVSSGQFKHDVHNIDNGLATIMALRPVTYRYNEGIADGGKQLRYGFIAEEYAEVLPHLSRFAADGHANGVDMMGLIPELVGAIQKQQIEINMIKQKLH